MPVSSCVPPAVPSVIQSPVWPLALMPLNSAPLPKTVRSVGAIPAELAPAMEVNSRVPAAVPSDVHNPTSPTELTPSNRIWPLSTVMSRGESPEELAPDGANSNVPLPVPLVSQRPL